MSYVRFGEDDSNVYVFVSSQGIECCGCALQAREWVEDKSRLIGGYLKSVGEIVPDVFDSNAGMIEHLDLHRSKGHTVPEYVFERLRDPDDERRNREIWAESA